MQMVCDEAASAAPLQRWAPTTNRDAESDKCDPLYCVHRLPMAASITVGLPTVFDGSKLFLYMVARWNFYLAKYALVMASREAAGREVSPTAGVIDSQS